MPLKQQQQQQDHFKSTSSAISTSTSSLLSLKENLGENNKSDHVRSNDLLTEIITKSEETIVTTTNAIIVQQQQQDSSSRSRSFKSKKTNLKNLQNKKISVCTNTKGAFNTIDNILTKCDKNISMY